METLNLGGVGNGALIVEGTGTELNRPGDRVGSVLKFGTGDATISVLDGGLLESGAILHLGQQGSRIQVLVSGAGSELSFASCAEAAGCGGLDFGFLGLVDVGSSSETSTTTVEQGARLEINARDNLSAGLNLQRNHVLTVDGPGSEVHVTGTQNGTSGAVRAGVGIEQTSALHVTNGGKVAVVPMNIGTSGVLAGSQFVADTNKPAAKIVVDGTGSLIDAELFAIGERFVFDSVGQDFVEGGPGGLSEAIIRNGGLVKAERILIGESGVLKGSDGTLQGAVENRGTILPGESPGILNIVGDYTQTESGLLVIEIGGTAPGSFDVLNISGKATLDGTLKIELIDGFTPGATDTFEFLIASLFEGNFSAFDLPTFGANQTFAVNLGPGGFQASVSAVPVPAAGWLFGAALGALAYRRRGQEVPKNRS